MDTAPQSQLRWTLEGFREGALATLPLMPGLCAFGLAFGTIAARKGLSLFDACIMSATVYAGVAQIIVVESWPEQLTFATIVASAAITALICSRFILIGASMRPWLGGLPPAKVYPMLYLLTEPPWLLSTRYYRGGGRDPSFLLGSCLATWLTWVSCDGAGLLAWRVAGRSQSLRPRSCDAGLLCRDAGVALAGAAPRHRLGRGKRRGDRDCATVRWLLVRGDRRTRRQHHGWVRR